MTELQQRIPPAPEALGRVAHLGLLLVTYAAAGFAVIIGLWWIDWLASLVTGGGPHGPVLTVFGRVAAAFGAMGLAAVLFADVTLGWGVCSFAAHQRRYQEEPT